MKSLTLRGFKSFASSTTLRLEPGVTCVVGPNGSGKSNVVDALAWVMGEQGAKSLRGGKMEDVIFAGTAARAPLGRAEVVVTIDNSDGALPIDYAEVTISRTMFRGGGSEYAINGTPCRLLDVSELLSDSGIGREMHVIVGQGQLEAILHATAEDRRGFIEEAAGVLKHRKRKEKALRKLDATEQNLTRLADLLGEIRRQLKPLGRQAEVARRASVVQMEVRDAKSRLLADDVVTMRAAQDKELADERRLVERREQIEGALTDARAHESELERQVQANIPEVAAAAELWFELNGVRERLLSTARLAAERVRHAQEPSGADDPGRDPELMHADAERLRDEERATRGRVAELEQRLASALEERQRAEAASVEEDRRVADLLRAAADRREGLAHLSGQMNTLRSRIAAADEEIGRLEAARAEAVARAARAQHDFTALETRIAGLDAGEQNLDAEHEAAQLHLRALDDRLAKARDELSDAERQRAALTARADALRVALSRKDGAAALAGASGDVDGLLGAVAELLSVRAGYEKAVAAALGAAAEAVVVRDADAAVRSLRYLKESELGRAELVVAAGGSQPAAPTEAVPEGTIAAADVVTAPESVRAVVRALLADTVVVGDLAQARRLVADRPDLVAVTAEGDVLGRHRATGGSASQPSPIELQAALDSATADLADARAAGERLQFELAGLQAEREDTQGRVDVALAKLHESDASMAAIAEELAQLGSLARNAKAEAARVSAAMEAAQASRRTAESGLDDVRRRVQGARESPAHEPDTSRQHELAEGAKQARQVELEARLALRTAEEQARALGERAAALADAADREHRLREQARVRRERRRREAVAAAAVAVAAPLVLARLDASREQAAQHRRDLETARAGDEERLRAARTAARSLDAELATLTDSVHRDEVLRAEHRLRMEQLAERVADELGLDLDALVRDYGPDQPVPVIASGDEGRTGGTDSTEPAEATPYVRDQQARRLRAAERALAELGRVNPLALEEFSALEERHRFLGEQLEDLRATRRDLLEIVKEVDDRVQQVFADAFADVAREFEGIFGRLFPGGEGRLVLTEPSDLLLTGVDVEARPAGKKIKRLSLLSGGERSLVAVAFLVALFKARPSPFYVLDEVEAALDDTNLGRLLEIYEELREHSQLVVITHQKRTMECADALYGVSMRGDGVSTVVSQRLRDADR